MFNCVVLFLIVKDLFLNKFFFGCGKNLFGNYRFFYVNFLVDFKKMVKGKRWLKKIEDFSC